MNALIAANIVDVEYSERIIAAKHPNWQRVFAPLIREDIAAMMNNANRVGMTITNHLKAHDWDSFEQYFKIKHPYAF